MIQPYLLVVVHTEEEFDWNAPFSRTATATSHIPSLVRGQQLFDAHGIRPVYAIDWPVVTDPQAVETLRSFVDRGAVIGTHLHPWVSPPFEETVGRATSYPGNLPAALERAKITTLTHRITTAFDMRPRIYLAGRYGFGPNTAATLEALGYEVDLSPSPPFDFRADGGPDYRHTDLRPVRVSGIWCVPHTGAFIGPFGAWPRALAAWSATGPLGRVWRSVAGRQGLLQRVRLSPEGFEIADLRRLTLALIDRGIRLFVFSLHSPSLTPGFTPYVRDEDGLRRLLSTIDEYLHWFRSELQGQGVDPSRFGCFLNHTEGEQK